MMRQFAEEKCSVLHRNSNPHITRDRRFQPSQRIVHVTQPPKTVPPTMCEFSETGEAGRLVKKGGMVEVYFFEEWVVLEVKQVGNRRS